MTPRRTAIARMDEEIARPTDTLSNLEKNTLCFIYRLPTETLEAIFIQNAHDYFRDARGWRCGPIVPSWVNVSYVSRHWRNVALNCATLWTYLFVTTPRWTEELLARSKQASLKLDVYACGRDEERRVFRFLEQVMDHVERIQELDLAIEPHDAFLSKLCSRAPRLQHLQLMCKSYYSYWSSISFQDPPALRTLRLMHCSVPLDSFKLSGLTKLNLRQVFASSKTSRSSWQCSVAWKISTTYISTMPLLAPSIFSPAPHSIASKRSICFIFPSF